MKLLLYCTKAKPYLKYSSKINGEDDEFFTINSNILKTPIYNGKIVAECDFEVEKIAIERCLVAENYTTNTMDMNKLLKCSCLTEHELINYEPNYAIHIKNLHIFDEPIELEKCYNDSFSSMVNYAPQNMMYSWLWNNKWDRYVLISIRPEWLCKILNGEKTIEVRKKILKEMMKND